MTPPVNPQDATTPPGIPLERLPRRLGLVSATAILVGIIIGSGIFRVPSVVVREVGSSGAAVAVWVLGGIVTVCGALSLTELATRYPRPGGAYVFLREAYGPLVAFLFGWVKLLITGPSALAAVALIFAAYTGAFVDLGGERGERLVAIALLAGLTLVNLRSVTWSAAIQTLATSAKVLALGVLALALLALGPGTGALAEPLVWSPTSWGGFGVALIAVLWTYTGWVDFTYLAGEVRQPERTYPRAMIAGLITVVVVYLLANAAFLYVLPLSELAGSRLVAATAAERVFGAVGSSLVAALVMLSTFGSLNGTLLANPRLFFSMADDGLFFRGVAAVHPRYQTPWVAGLVYLGLGTVGLLTQTFEQLAQLFILGIWPFYALSVAAVFVIRRREPAPPNAYRSWGYPVLPALFVVISLAMLLNGFLQRPAQTALSLGILLLGIPAYYGWRAYAVRAGRPIVAA